MATWSEKFNKVTQTAISKSKEMAEVTRLNMEISTYTQSLKELYIRVGECVTEQNLPQDNETIMDLKNQIMAIKANIEKDQEKLNTIRNIGICPNCKGEISRDSKFCDKCGVEINREILEPVNKTANVCKKCGSFLTEGAIFCGNCGSKQE